MKKIPSGHEPKPSGGKRRNSSKVNLVISLVFHALILFVLVFLAAREGLLGKQLKKITVEMVKEKPPEKPKEKVPEKPPVEPERPKPTPPPEAVKIAEPPKPAVPVAQQGLVPAQIPAAVAPPPAEVPSFAFDGGKAVQSTSDPVHLYRSFIEHVLRSKWNRPTDLADDAFVAEVDLAIDSGGRILSSDWKSGSGDTRWDNSVRDAIASTSKLDRPPPRNFPGRVRVRFDIQTTEPVFQ